MYYFIFFLCNVICNMMKLKQTFLHSTDRYFSTLFYPEFLPGEADTITFDMMINIL